MFAAMTAMTVSFIGLGNMGHAMARHLLATALAEKLTAAHDARGAILVSAPVFGRPDAAAARKLFIVAAGPDAALDRCQPLFDAVGQRTFRIGAAPRLANVVKLSGNFLIASIIESLGEVFALVLDAARAAFVPMPLASLIRDHTIAA